MSAQETEASTFSESPSSYRDWTWADMLSTYRFWGLFAFFVLMGISFYLFVQFAIFHIGNYAESLGVPRDESGMLLATRNTISAYGCLLGFYLAWLASRWRSIAVLLAAGVLLIAACFLLELSGSLAANYIASFFSQAAIITILIGVPALIAGNRAGTAVFAVAFGLALFANEYLNFFGAFYAVNQLGFTASSVGFAVIGTAFLVPVKRELFAGPPPERVKSLPCKRRSPVVTALLCMFVPFYIFYWVYRAFAETKRLTGKRGILSSRGAVLLGIFVPLLMPVMNVDLTDALNDAVKDNESVGRRPWAVAIWTIFVPPVGCALVQSLMNRAAQSR